MNTVPQAFNKTERNRIDRIPVRGSYDKDTVYGIIDEAPLCVVSFAQGDQAFVIPTIHVRNESRLYFHGATKSRLVAAMSSGQPLSMCFTLLDGLVIARSVVHNSMNYRSVVAFGIGHLVKDDGAKTRAFRLLSDKLIPGRWEDCKRPTQVEIDMTAVVEVTIQDASAKIRKGPPVDVESDYELPYWAGVIPIRSVYSDAQRDPRLDRSIENPSYLPSENR